MDLNHLILNTLTLSINKINAAGAITMSTLDATLAHYRQYTLPTWATKSSKPNFQAYALYMVCLSSTPQFLYTICSSQQSNAHQIVAMHRIFVLCSLIIMLICLHRKREAL
jgi:hypothetical protein